MKKNIETGWKRSPKVPRGKYVLIKNKKSDLCHVHIQYIVGRERIHRALSDGGVKCHAEDWNATGNLGRGELKPTYGKGYKAKNDYLQEYVDGIDAQLTVYNKKHPNLVTRAVVESILDGKPLTRRDEGKDFEKYVVDYVTERYHSNKILYSRYENFICCMRRFAKFLKSEGKGTYAKGKIYLGQVTPELIADYIAWRREEGNSDDTINHSLTPIIQACVYAADMGLIDNSLARKIKDMRINSVQSLEAHSTRDEKIKYLTEEELKRLVNYYQICKLPRRKAYLEAFLFAIQCAGLRLSDIMTLQWEEIDWKKKELCKVLVKTRNRNYGSHRIPLSDATLDFLRKQQEKHINETYVFDFLPADFDINDQKALRGRSNTVEKSLSQSFAPVAKELGFDKLTMHMARHTFAVLAINRGMGLHELSTLMGHHSIEVTQQIYAKLLPNRMKGAMDDLNLNIV